MAWKATRTTSETVEFSFRCGSCGLERSAFAFGEGEGESRSTFRGIAAWSAELQASLEARRLAKVSAAFARCPTCSGRRARAGLLISYWLVRAFLAVTVRTAIFGGIAYAILRLFEDETVWRVIVIAVVLIGGGALTWSAGRKYAQAISQADERIRFGS